MFTVDQIKEITTNIGPPWQRVLGVAAQKGTWVEIYAEGEQVLDWRRLFISLGFQVEIKWAEDLPSGAILRVDWSS